MSRHRKTGRAMRKRMVLSSLSVPLMVLGVGFGGYNLLNFSQGYHAVDNRDIEASEFVSTAGEETGELPAQKVAADRDFDPLYSTFPEEGEEFGELIIPKLKAAMPVFHGADPDELAKGVGHYAESVLPGMGNNSVLSGHRGTVFRELGKVGEGDLLIVRTEAGEFTYKVHTVRIVDDMDKTVIVQKDEATLTLTTCYPFGFIGDAPKRYVLVAELVNSNTNKVNEV
ncbi:class D sortase [Planococcus lenghuensis]|uniref:Class D sortase n=1 Tax=Planococcus lenghuensis TaxID=2213202 RepID=A0A1Q2L4T4_9BACL|nr:class D sortase [Planococcus lenghuensis]AQQ55460.1 hypothetical protein B0X71_20085 [Planococcus lenghuensis]